MVSRHWVALMVSGHAVMSMKGMEIRFDHHLVGSIMVHWSVISVMRASNMMCKCRVDILMMYRRLVDILMMDR